MMLKTKPKQAPIDMGSKAGRTSAWSELRQILERELTKPLAADADRLEALCNALEVGDSRLEEFRGALALHAKCEKEFNESMKVRGECKSDALTKEFHRGDKAFIEAVAKREQLKEQIREAEAAEVSAIHISENSRQMMNQITGSWSALFRGQEMPDKPTELLRQEVLNAIGAAFTATGDRVR